MQLPGFANWPIMKQILSLMLSVLTFIFEALESIGIVNVGLTVIIFAFLLQLCILPFRICKSIKRGKKIKRNIKLAEIKKEYQDRMDDEAAVAEMHKKQEAVKAEYKDIKGLGCLLTIAQIVIVILSFTAIGCLDTCIPTLANATEAELTAAYSFLGMNLKESAQQSIWPNGLFALCYLLLHFVPGLVKQYRTKKKEKEMLTEGMSEEEKLEYKKKNKFSFKTGGYEIFQFVMNFWWPLMYGGLSFTLPTLYLIYWMIRQLFSAGLYNAATKIHSLFKECKKRPHNKNGVIESVTYTEVKTEESV